MYQLTYRADKGRREGIIAESEQNARLSYARVTDQQQFEQQVVCLLGHFFAVLFLLNELFLCVEIDLNLKRLGSSV